MSTNYNQFLISTADVIVRDVQADQIMVYGKTEIDSTIAQKVTSADIQGGYGNQVLYTYQHSKMLDITISDAKFEEGFLAINSGTLITNGAKNIFKREFITLNGSGIGTITTAPVGNVYLQSTTGVIATVVPSTMSVTYVGFANQTVEAVYKYSVSVDTIDLNASLFTKTYELTLIAKMFDKNGQSAEVHIVIPQFKPDGNFTITLKADGYSTTPMAGKAIADQATKSYGSYNIAYTTATIAYTNIVASPSTVALSVGTPTQILTIYGLRGGNYAPVTLDPSLCTFVSGTPATCTVSAGGLLTRIAVGTSLISVTNIISGLKDYVNVTAS
ncbi:MAG TPA: hypothetical protein VIK86_08090 [Candidatus Paceibacterota bacterium]